MGLLADFVLPFDGLLDSLVSIVIGITVSSLTGISVEPFGGKVARFNNGSFFWRVVDERLRWLVRFKTKVTGPRLARTRVISNAFILA